MPYRDSGSRDRSRNNSEKSDDYNGWSIHNDTDNKLRKFSAFSNNKKRDQSPNSDIFSPTYGKSP